MTIRIRELVIKADISEQKNSEQEVRKSEESDPRQKRISKFINRQTKQRQER
ncbi:MAG: DUF5908 family protein [Paludibacteraceae bacterium]|jgi:hypothetical protein|nr:DUF5908 family protein [Paludibacteraceae bacterium]